MNYFRVFRDFWNSLTPVHRPTLPVSAQIFRLNISSIRSFPSPLSVSLPYAESLTERWIRFRNSRQLLMPSIRCYLGGRKINKSALKLRFGPCEQKVSLAGIIMNAITTPKCILNKYFSNVLFRYLSRSWLGYYWLFYRWLTSKRLATILQVRRKVSWTQQPILSYELLFNHYQLSKRETMYDDCAAGFKYQLNVKARNFMGRRSRRFIIQTSFFSTF